MLSPRNLSLALALAALLARTPAGAQDGNPRGLPRKELQNQFRTITAELTHLVEDMQIDLRPSPEHSQLVSNAEKVREEARHLSAATRDADPHHLLKDYRQFDAAWHHLADTLQQSRPSRHVQEAVTRVDRVDQAIHDLLAIPAAQDRDQIGRLADDLARATRHLLVDLEFDLPRNSASEQLVVDGRNLAKEAHHFAKAVAPNADFTILQDYQAFDAAWHDLSEQLTKTRRTPQVDEGLQRVDRLHEALHRLLSVSTATDWEPVSKLAKQLVSAAADLNAEAQSTLRSSRYAPIVQAADKFAESAEHFDRSLAEGAEVDHARRDLNKLEQAWEQLDTRIRYLRIFRYRRVHRAAARVSPLMTQLREAVGIAPEPQRPPTPVDIKELIRELGR